jgi:hypothetical protein
VTIGGATTDEKLSIRGGNLHMVVNSSAPAGDILFGNTIGGTNYTRIHPSSAGRDLSLDWWNGASFSVGLKLEDTDGSISIPVSLAVGVGSALTSTGPGGALVASAYTDTTSASNISSGTLAAARGGAGTVTGALKGDGAGVVSQAAASDLSNGTVGSGAVVLSTSNIYPAIVNVKVSVDFSADGDTIVPVTALPSPFTRYLINTVRLSGASADLSTATAGVFTAAGGAGVAIVTAASAITVTATADATNNNAQTMTLNNAQTTSFTAAGQPNLYFRVAGTASGTGNVTIALTLLP